MDGLGRVLSVISPEGRKTRYRYDERGDVLSTTSPSGAETSLGYDADGNLVKIVAPGGSETTRSYDVMDRLVSETDPLGHTAEWAYDAAGDLTAYTNRDGEKTAYSYDPMRRLTSAAYGVSGLIAESSVSYGYNDANRPVSIDDTASGEYGLAPLAPPHRPGPIVVTASAAPRRWHRRSSPGLCAPRRPRRRQPGDRSLRLPPCAQRLDVSAPAC